MPVEVTTGTEIVVINVEPPEVSVRVSALNEVRVLVVKCTRRSELEAELAAARWIPLVIPALASRVTLEGSTMVVVSRLLPWAFISFPLKWCARLSEAKAPPATTGVNDVVV